MRLSRIALAAILVALSATAASKPHVMSLGKAMPVKLFLAPEEERALTITVRPLYLDSKLKDYTTGPTHDVTDRMFVVRRAYRVNDSLPGEAASQPKWLWQRGGWLLVDRTTAHVTQLNVPDFDPFYSSWSWFRDYIAYCGLSDDGTKVYAMVDQIGRKKPVLKQKLGDAKNGDMPESECAVPHWERSPIRVTFEPTGGQKQTFSVFGHAADAMPVGADDDE